MFIHLLKVLFINKADESIMMVFKLIVLIAENLFPFRGQIEFVGRDIPVPDAVVGTIYGKRKSLICFEQRFIHLLALGDILMGAEHQQRFALRGP